VAAASAGANEKPVDDHVAALEELVHHLQDRVDKLEDFVTTQHESILKQCDQLGELEDFITTQHEMILKQTNLLNLAKMPVMALLFPSYVFCSVFVDVQTDCINHKSPAIQSVTCSA